MSEKLDLSFAEISQRLHSVRFPEIDRIVGILRGGQIPSILIAHQLAVKNVSFMGLNFRDDTHTPRSHEPQMTMDWDPSELNAGERILLVDDVVVSGSTIKKALSLLDGFEVTTFAMKGAADIVAFPEIETCVNWPWK